MEQELKKPVGKV